MSYSAIVLAAPLISEAYASVAPTLPAPTTETFRRSAIDRAYPAALIGAPALSPTGLLRLDRCNWSSSNRSGGLRQVEGERTRSPGGRRRFPRMAGEPQGYDARKEDASIL